MKKCAIHQMRRFTYKKAKQTTAYMTHSNMSLDYCGTFPLSLTKGCDLQWEALEKWLDYSDLVVSIT